MDLSRFGIHVYEFKKVNIMAKQIAKRGLSGMIALALVVTLILDFLPLNVNAEEEQTALPDAKNCVVYKNKTEESARFDEKDNTIEWTGIVPTFYMWNYEQRDAVCRIYSDSVGGELMGTATYNHDSHYWAAPLTPEANIYKNNTSKRNYGDKVYVTLQESGKAESERVAVPYPEHVASVSFEVTGLVNRVLTEPISESSKNAGGRASTPQRLTVGTYYVVDVLLNDFTKLQSITLPIKYDPSVLELTSLKYNGSGYVIKSSSTANSVPVNTGESGSRLTAFMTPSNMASDYSSAIGGNPTYGIGVYSDLCKMGAIQDTKNTGNSQSPYVNTETGLIKLELNNQDNVIDLSTLSLRDTSGRTCRLVRIYFKCIKRSSSSAWNIPGSPLRFATSDDVPAGVTDDTVAQRYYHLTSPNGCRASIQAINLLTTPLTAKVNLSAQKIMFLSEEVSAMPQAAEQSFDEKIAELIHNTVHVYNYTNFVDYTGIDEGIDDALILSPSSDMGAAKQGDKISVYTKQGASFVKIIDEQPVDNEGGIALNLGTKNLDPAGGSVYVSVTRYGYDESAKIEVKYSPEMNRNVYFDLKASRYDHSATKRFSDYKVTSGEQLRLDIYFNNFSELYAYTFNIKYNKSVVQVSDRNFVPLIGGGAKGQISAASLSDGSSCLEIGQDLQSGVTFNEREALEAYKKFQAGEMSQADAMDLMNDVLPGENIDSLSAMDDVAQKIEMKLSFGDSLAWEGGLLFSHPDSTGLLYPYFDNNNGEIRVSSISLESAPVDINKTGVDADGNDTHGYHFLSIYFTAVTSGDPGFTISGAGSEVNSGNVKRMTVNSTDGTEMVLGGPGSSGLSAYKTASKMPFMGYWSVAALEEKPRDPVIRLTSGNNGTSDDLYLYEGYPFRDPGFLTQNSKGQIVVNTANPTQISDAGHAVKRTVVRSAYGSNDVSEADRTFSLDAWQKDEKINLFTIPEGHFSATYTITYTYEEAADKAAEPQSRKVIVIRNKGDYNGDGHIGFLDELVNIDDALGDSNFVNYTAVDSADPGSEEAMLNAVLMKQEFTQIFTMPVAKPDPEPDGPGSGNADDMKLAIEFYDASVDPAADPRPTPLDPSALTAGKDVIMAVKMTNLSSMLLPLADPDADNGIGNIAVAIGYNSDNFTLSGFDEDMGEIGYYSMGQTSDAYKLNVKWITALDDTYKSPLYSLFISTNASDIPLDETTRRVYIQYRTIVPDAYAWMNDEVYLAAFKFKVGSKGFEDSPFSWLDYDIAVVDDSGVADGSDEEIVLKGYNRQTLLNGTTPFQKPEDVLTSAEGAVGYTITGEVVSYNAKNPVTYELYKMGDDGQYETTPTYTGTAVEAEATTSGNENYQHFQIENVISGNYTLVLKKKSHVDFVVKGIMVSADVNLSGEVFPASIRSIVMGAGDLNSDNIINNVDQGIIIRSDNYFHIVASEEQERYDINGDGTINNVDQGIIIRSTNYFKSTEDNFTIDISADFIS